MAKKEVKTDLWVYELLQEANIHLTPQGCDIKEIDEALRTASKSKTGNAGYPEYCGVVKDFILVIEDKASLAKHIYKDENDLLSQEVKVVKDYAVNGALYYALHLAVNTSYNKIIALGVSGNENIIGLHRYLSMNVAIIKNCLMLKHSSLSMKPILMSII